MKLFIITISLFSALQGRGQCDAQMRQTDSLVQRIEQGSGQAEKFRWLLGYVEQTTTGAAPVKLTRSYKAGPKQIIETFYLHEGKLVFATKQAGSYYLYGDSTVYLGKYYFSHDSLTCYTLYHGQEDTGHQQVQKNVLASYNKVLAIFKRKKGKKL